ncbi:Shikimate dehydrogenase [Candidatus Johnevansia muelleri]|uniref:Shikimate dehydrogenase (NADP(+)) n=1 Tax=Candidatus Johnevansia muelleri TaxID=1495769 RepID=A0A078KB83_9GAMM|nr:Shikimate dehydrogenase [Candidatus Evansia muelleri]
MKNIFCVFGNPIKHSRSPLIHKAFAKQFNESIIYEARFVKIDSLYEAWDIFRNDGGIGANVTVPFKQKAINLADIISYRAYLSGTINTLFVGYDGRVYGDTTDGVGLVRDLKRLGIKLKSKRIAIIGAGGAVRSIIQPLIDEKPRYIFISNRTASKGKALAKYFSIIKPHSTFLEGGGLDQLYGVFDILINGTSASLSGKLPCIHKNIIKKGAIAYDMTYASTQTVFNKWAQNNGALTFDGLGMLIEQAAESFFLWHNKRPNTIDIHKAIRLEINKNNTNFC